MTDIEQRNTNLTEGNKMAKFQPKLFIGIGETSAYFTLRETYEHCIPGEGPQGNAVVNGVYQGTKEIRSFHHFNLSQDANEAVTKAKKSSLEIGLPLLPSKPETLRAEMRDIINRTAGEIKLAEHRRIEAIQAEEKRILDYKMRNEADKIAEFKKSARMPSGKYQGKRIQDLPREFCGWVVDKMEEFENYSFMAFLAETIFLTFPDRIPEPVFFNKDAHFGEIKKRYDLELVVAESFSFNGFYGLCYVTKMADKQGNCFVVMSGAFSADVGDKLKLKGTVTKHEVYKGQAQTVINRVKVIV